MKNDPVIAIAPEPTQKMAALLFDYIIPMGSAGSVPEEIAFKYKTKIGLPSTRLTKIDPIIKESIEKHKDRLQTMSEKDFFAFIVKDVDNILIKRHHDLLFSNGIRSVPVFHSIQPYETYLGPGCKQAVELKLCNAEIIDTAELEWKHVADIRKDIDFKRKLRNFRMFLIEHYENKDEKFIVDDLSRKLDEYKDACKRHGLKLVLATLSKTLDSKSLLGSLGVVAAGVLAGNPFAIKAALAGGIVVEIGKMAIHIAQKRLEFEQNVSNAELSYLIEIEKHRK